MAQRPQIKADTAHIDELVDRAARGRVRIPGFQRGWKWRAEDVQALFDSIYQGFPIGTLLMWKRPGEAERLELGRLVIDAPATDDAWWVIDGQQRLTSLVAGLLHPAPDLADESDPFVVWFDPDRGTRSPFFRPSRHRPAGEGAIPVAGLLDAGRFQAWLFERIAATGRRDLLQRGTDLATRFRDYRVPLYLIETGDGDVAREIFLRMNRTGRRMELAEIFAAIAPVSTAEEARPERVAERVSVGFGEIDGNLVARAAHHLDRDDIGGVATSAGAAAEREALMRRAEQALGRAVAFVLEAHIGHERLLPQGRTVLITLARFFDRFPDPSARNRRLLRRWLWRGLCSLALESDAKTLSAAVRAVGTDEGASVQALLRQVPRDEVVDLPDTFDARDAASRLCLLVLSLQRPHAPPDTEEQEVVGWLRAYDDAVFTRCPDRARSPAARFLTPGVSPARWRDTLRAWAAAGDTGALASHLVSPEAAQALLAGEDDGFVAARAAALTRALADVHAAFAEPKHDDRPELVLAPDDA
jgi:hypothetical protein